MRIYKDEEIQGVKLSRVICNCCGRGMKVKEGILKEGCFSVDYAFDYFSRKDGYIYRLDVCESCFDSWIGKFKEPVQIDETKEFL